MSPEGSTSSQVSISLAPGVWRGSLLSRVAWAGGHADVWRWFDHPETLRVIAAALVEPCRDAATKVAGIESRGAVRRSDFQRAALGAGERVLLVDDWIETGSQAAGPRTLIEECGATFLGVAAIVDQLPADRREQLVRVHTLLPKALLGDDGPGR